MFQRNKYRLWYLRIINTARKENRKKGCGVYYEKHHILPKSIFPQFRWKKWNHVLLTGREHFIVHRLLTKCVVEDYLHNMLCAVVLMATSNSKEYVNSRTYEAIRQQIASRPVPDEVRKKMSDFHTGKIMSAESRRKMSEGRKGIPKSEEHKRKIGEGNKGKVFTVESRNRMSEARKGVIIPEQTRNAVSKRHKGVPKSEEHRRKIGEGQFGKPGIKFTDGITIFTSFADAARQYNVTPEAIAHRCKSNNPIYSEWKRL